MMQSLSASWRLLRAIAHMLSGWWTIRFRFERLSPAERAQCVQQWAERLLNIMGIRLTVHGTPPAHGPVLVVCNHLSWLDIVAIHAARHVRFVSKASVRHWPVIGTLSTGAGTLYIERERRRDAVRVVHHMTEALRAGDIIAVFPEGTTSDGHGLLPFHANLLQAAISSGAPVQPAALRFADAASGQNSDAPRYVDDDNLLASLWNTLKAPPLLAIVHFGEPQPSTGRDRRGWAKSLHADVQSLRRELR
ncbi:lysophospholipid acyltransferase family protein [Variovorax ginsengisoli]|uniref:Lysophospholipid acyltransferase family protein n=1 Tax=Variovorax ginsengisoli TaxID=363844 RepID=A0ABT8S0F0_9BURK|nr:lysophospholipid acyltransferase family protein [Variovorax ginsengisoli]MDN8613236.1 lysophospholipid acyltransferase family protein [Variovorax ginsengisoli]MDO1532406.1 lysophospholipid acyltransferase family protein [Variovorax ginsengisoli]